MFAGVIAVRADIENLKIFLHEEGCCQLKRCTLKRGTSGKLPFFPYGKGSNTKSPIILKLGRAGKAPAATINLRTGLVLSTGPLVCRDLYGREIPGIDLEKAGVKIMRRGQKVVASAVDGKGVIKG
jgi:predicted aconitase with swiveling domain